MNTPSRLQKITKAQVRNILLKLVNAQGGICPLCKLPLDVKDRGAIVLDHDHITGRVRGALHRSCNSGEGKVFNAAGRWIAGKMDYTLVKEVLQNLLVYLDKSPTNYVYYTHQTEDERKAVRAQKERLRRAKVKAAREARSTKVNEV